METISGVRCVATKDDDTRCKSDFGINPANSMCFYHDPEREEERRRAGRKGGKTRWAKQRLRDREPLLRDDLPTEGPPSTLAEVCAWLSWVAFQTAIGRLETKQAREITNALSKQQKALEARDVEGDVEELEKQIAAIKRGK